MNAPLHTERRKHERLNLLREEAVISMESDFGPIVEMSSNGFSAEYCNHGCLPGKECCTNIFVRGGTMIKNIPIKFEWVKAIKTDTPHTLSTATVGARFQNLTFNQKLKIAALLKWHTQD